MTDQELRYRIVAQDDMTVTLEAIRGELDTLNEKSKASGEAFSNSFQMAGMALQGWIDIIRTTAGYAENVINDFAEMEKQVTMLNASLVAAGHNTKSYSMDFQDLATNLSNTTFATREQVLASERLLLQYGVSADKMHEIMGALGNYTVATGRDMESVTMRVAYAVSGMTDNLRRVGIPVELKGITDEGERLDKIIQAINEHWPEMTGTISGTSAMELHQAANEWKEFKEAVGELAWERYQNGVVALTDALKYFTQESKSIGGDVEASIQQAIDSYGKLYEKSQETLERVKQDPLRNYSLFGMETELSRAQRDMEEMQTKYRDALGRMAAYRKEKYGEALSEVVITATPDENSEKEKARKEGERLEYLWGIKQKARAMDKAADEAAAKEAQKLLEQKFEATKLTFQGIAALAKVFGREGFEISKQASAADAIVSGVLAVQKTLASLPYPWNIAAAAGVAASAAANVAQIESTTYGGGAGNISAPSGTTGMGSAGTSTNPIQTTPTTSGQNVSIVVNGFVGSESTLASELGRVFREATNDNVNFGLQTTSR
jgi:hypothetical protein